MKYSHFNFGISFFTSLYLIPKKEIATDRGKINEYIPPREFLPPIAVLKAISTPFTSSWDLQMVESLRSGVISEMLSLR